MVRFSLRFGAKSSAGARRELGGSRLEIPVRIYIVFNYIPGPAGNDLLCFNGRVTRSSLEPQVEGVEGVDLGPDLESLYCFFSFFSWEG